ncbi:unnamed protein product [Sphagnum balticum]
MAEDKAENQIRLEVCSGGIAFITLNRPKALNALTKDMLTRLRSFPRNWIRGLPSKFGIFPSWRLSQNLPHVIGPHGARQVSLTAESVDAQTAE